MKKETRLKFNNLKQGIAKSYGVEDVSEKFSATPSVEQKLMDKIQISNEFLERINVIGVDDAEGETVLGSTGPIIGSRTDTSGTGERTPKQLLNLDGFKYKCEKADFDVAIKYKTLDQWAKFKDLNSRYMSYVKKGIASGRLIVGWNGISVAPFPDATANPLGQDVNKGWLQHLREYQSGSQMLAEGGTTGEIRLGGAGDFVNLDAAVDDLKKMVGEEHRNSGDLVALIGTDLMSFDKTQLYKAQGQTPTEKERVESNAVTRTYGGLPAYNFGFFPARGLMVTSFDNLSIYFQQGSVRQHIQDRPSKDQIEHFNSFNDAYVIEDFEKAASLEFDNVRIWNGTNFS